MARSETGHSVWFAVVVLAMNYLQYQAAVAYLQTQSVCSLTDIIRQHCLAHWRQFLRRALTQLLRSRNIDTIIESLLPAASWAVTQTELRRTTCQAAAVGGVPHLLLSRASAPSASVQVAVLASVLKVQYAYFGETTGRN